MSNIRYKHLTDLLSVHPTISVGTLISAPNVCLSAQEMMSVSLTPFLTDSKIHILLLAVLEEACVGLQYTV